MEVLMIIILALFVTQHGWVKGLLKFAGYWLMGAIIAIVVAVVGIILLIGFFSWLGR